MIVRERQLRTYSICTAPVAAARTREPKAEALYCRAQHPPAHERREYRRLFRPRPQPGARGKGMRQTASCWCQQDVRRGCDYFVRFSGGRRRQQHKFGNADRLQWQ